MKIINEKPKQTTFFNIDFGECFLARNDEIFMKIQSCYKDGEPNNLQNTILFMFWFKYSSSDILKTTK